MFNELSQNKFSNINRVFNALKARLLADEAHNLSAETSKRLNAEEEYELLGLFREAQRQEYLKRHLSKVLPMLTEMESLKTKVKLNGHFRNLEGFSFDL